MRVTFQSFGGWSMDPCDSLREAAAKAAEAVFSGAGSRARVVQVTIFFDGEESETVNGWTLDQRIPSDGKYVRDGDAQIRVTHYLDIRFVD